MATKFFLCTTCGNVVVKLVDSGVIPVCCGKQMVEIVPGTMDASKEKHLPVIECGDGCMITVKVGSQPHPMTNGHHVAFICVETENGVQIRYLDPTGEPEAEFCVCADKATAVYEYCNIHGLWKTENIEDQDCECSCCKD